MIEPVDVDPLLMQDLRQLELKKRAIAEFVNQVIAKGEVRQKEFLDDSQKVWKKVGARYGLDLEKVVWVLHPNKNQVVPMQVTLDPPEIEQKKVPAS